MADKKLNEVTKVTDMAYVPVIMADGSIGQIAKSDLASVVAGVLSTKANTPLLHHEGSLYSAENPFDIDSFYMGIVTLNKSSWSSYPVNEGVAPQEDMRGTLFAYRNDNGSGFFGSQVFTSLDNVAYIRNFWGNTMGSWRRIDNFGYNSLAELAGGVGGMYYKGTFSNTKDCTETGVYYNDEGDAEDLPDNFGKQIMLTVIKCPSIFVQEVTSYITGGVYRRVVNPFLNDWGDWKRVDNV